MKRELALVIGAALIAAAIAVSHRYSMGVVNGADDYSSVWRVDQWTGKILTCDYGKGFTEPGCTEVSITAK